jgi:hypothetical protein
LANCGVSRFSSLTISVQIDEVTFGEVIGAHRSRHGGDSQRVRQRIAGRQHR